MMGFARYGEGAAACWGQLATTHNGVHIRVLGGIDELKRYKRGDEEDEEKGRELVSVCVLSGIVWVLEQLQCFPILAWNSKN